MSNKFARAALWIGALAGLAAIFLAASFFIVLRATLGHYAGNQVRRGIVRSFVCGVRGGKPVSFKTSDGITLKGILLQRPHARGSVVLCHGYRHSKEQMTRYIDLFPDCNLLFFDFRAFGESEGSFSSIGYYESRDVRAAVEYMRSSVPLKNQRPLIVFGVSMGAAAALKAAAENSFGIDGLILDSPYASLPEIVDQAAHHFSFIPRPLMYSMVSAVEYVLGPILRMNPERYIPRIAVPVLFVHAATDSITNASHSVRLFSQMYKHKQAPSWLWLTPPAKHAYSYLSYPKQYALRVANFLGALRARA